MYKLIFSGLVLSMFITACDSIHSASIRLDGVIGKDEWKHAAEYLLENGGKILLKKEDAVLYTALVIDRKGWAHAYLSDGDKVKVMHASAALDAVDYKNEHGLWRTVDSFVWVLRDTVYNNEVLRKMEAYYEKNDWVANNVNMGDGMTLEFKFNISRWDKKPLYFSCLMADYDVNLHYFPPGLSDDTLMKRLIQGYAVDSLRFEPTGWKTVSDFK